MINYEQLNNRIAVFGAGRYGEYAYRVFKDRIGLFVDNSRAKQGQKFHGREIVSFEQYLKVRSEFSPVIAIRDNEEVIRQIFGSGIDECFVFYMAWGPLQEEFIIHRLSRSDYQTDHKRERFEALRKIMPEERAYGYAYKEKWDICLTGLYTEANFGAQLTYCSLYRYLTDMGYTVLMNQPPLSAEVTPWRFPRFFYDGIYPLYDTCPVYDTAEDMRVLNSRTDCFMLGSDQMWNMELMRGREYISFFRFADKEKKIITYASSFGKAEWDGTSEETAEMRETLERCSAVSVREQSGTDLCRSKFGKDAVCCIDPVFFFGREYYDEMAGMGTVDTGGGYFMSYVFFNTDENRAAINKWAERHNSVYKEFRANSMYVYDWLKHIKNADFIITNSFHAMCFAIIFRKKFAVLRLHWMERIEDMLSRLGLENRLIGSAEELSARDDLLEEIDYGAVFVKLEDYIYRSKQWLNEQLKKYVKKGDI